MNRLLLLAAFATAALADPPEPKFLPVTLDDKVQIGYGVAVADVDGDGLPDVLLADKKQFVWYKNPGGEKAHDPAAWQRYVLAENLTANDNVCIAAQDIDGDGKCEIAVGAEWNPSDTVNSGAVFYLIPPVDRTQKWEPVKFPSVEPTTHRMRWIQVSEKEWALLVVPLHGRGNKDGQGAAVKVLLYHKPENPRAEWKSEVIDESMHMTHNFDVLPKDFSLSPVIAKMRPFLFFGGREGVHVFPSRTMWVGNDGSTYQSAGIGEIRFGYFQRPRKMGTMTVEGMTFLAAIEPMHGNQLTFYLPIQKAGARHEGQERHVLTDKLTEGHALRCGDVIGNGTDQIVVGWRGTPGKEGSTMGIHLWAPLDGKGDKWRDSAVDDGMSCEDLTLADLDGDGKLDIVASGRATHNLKVYFNNSAR